MSEAKLVPEIMIKAMSKAIEDGDAVMHGASSPLPVLAISLAKLTHAPNAVYISPGGGLDPDVDRIRLTLSSSDPKLTVGSVGFIEFGDGFDMCQKHQLNIMFFGAAQIDRYGNVNLSVIGDYDKPKRRLPAGAATAHIMSIVAKAVIWLARQSERTFIEKVDFRTGAGYLDGGDSREKAGAWPITIKVVTNLAVYGFDEKTKAMRVESIHPGITADMIRENTGFDIEIPAKVPRTEMPSEEDLRIIRRLDPGNVRYSEFEQI